MFNNLNTRVLSVVIIPKYPIKEIGNQKENVLYLEYQH